MCWGAQCFCRHSWGSPPWRGGGGRATGSLAAPGQLRAPNLRLCRYYYHKRILHKTKGKRFTYKFNFGRLIVVNYPLWELRAPPPPHLLLGAPALFRPAVLPMGMPSEVGVTAAPAPPPMSPPSPASLSAATFSPLAF